MKCKDCRWWVAPVTLVVPTWDFTGRVEHEHVAILEERRSCVRFPAKVEKHQDEFCGEFEERPEEELSEDERFKNSLKPTWDENNGDAAA